MSNVLNKMKKIGIVIVLFVCHLHFLTSIRTTLTQPLINIRTTLN